ncbi:GNAT family N-acetyltransferase [Pedobacter alluvionis]|uniref:N-acetyltransferase family protein n=1 Tax=Pedobacter alluvionis TaxID=475253 RepID=A0A497YBZ1_9SPHI|nr:GNAT family N-acetyltransferase [Pedobacter alluvionis]RLJ80198.1 phosphinothricin acetyltransferase [Pedobacter alluvionis]TFB31483.1 N-acetyltransferase family protein [Pedobacter alluvionis]
MEIIELLQGHWESVRTIYLHGIATKQATFQTAAPSWEEWDKGHLPSLRYVAVIEDDIAGWAALSPVSSRCVYAGVAEVSVYIHEGHRAKGVGTALLQRLISESEQDNIWTLQSGIFPENVASIALHERLGFRKIGYREKIGKMDGVWRDTVLMERRSKITGQD